MTEVEWLAATDPTPMLEFLRGKASDRKLRLFACAISRRLVSLAGGDDFVRGIDAAESYVDGGRKRAAMRRCRQALNQRMVDLVSSEAHRREWKVLYLGHIAISENQFRNFGMLLSEVRTDRWIGDPFQEELAGIHLVARDVFGNPFRPVAVDPAWLTSTVVQLAIGIYTDRAFDRLPILADALQDAGCEDADILGHCRGPGPHVRGCWVVDPVLGKG
jgi:hypothetical protein